MEVSARWAERDDLDILVALAAEAIEELTPHRGGAIWSQLDARTEPLVDGFRSTLASEQDAVIVGAIDHTVVGYAALTLRRLHDATWLGDLTDLYVMPGARGVGVGEEMMELAVNWCREKDCVGIDSVALPGDRATKNFFETFGLVARSLRVHRSLPPR